jgi:hypothetical protein
MYFVFILKINLCCADSQTYTIIKINYFSVDH